MGSIVSNIVIDCSTYTIKKFEQGPLKYNCQETSDDYRWLIFCRFQWKKAGNFKFWVSGD
jgi:hypothetical protein